MYSGMVTLIILFYYHHHHRYIYFFIYYYKVEGTDWSHFKIIFIFRSHLRLNDFCYFKSHKALKCGSDDATVRSSGEVQCKSAASKTSFLLLLWSLKSPRVRWNWAPTPPLTHSRPQTPPPLEGSFSVCFRSCQSAKNHICSIWARCSRFHRKREEDVQQKMNPFF